MPNAINFFGGSGTHVSYADLTQYTGMRLVVNKLATAGSTTGQLFIRYKDFFDPAAANWTTSVTTTPCLVNINGANNISVSGYVSLATAARSGVYIALMGSSGNGVLSPVFGNVTAFFK